MTWNGKQVNNNDDNQNNNNKTNGSFRFNKVEDRISYLPYLVYRPTRCTYERTAIKIFTITKNMYADKGKSNNQEEEYAHRS